MMRQASAKRRTENVLLARDYPTVPALIGGNGGGGVTAPSANWVWGGNGGGGVTAPSAQ